MMMSPSVYFSSVFNINSNLRVFILNLGFHKQNSTQSDLNLVHKLGNECLEIFQTLGKM